MSFIMEFYACIQCTLIIFTPLLPSFDPWGSFKTRVCLFVSFPLSFSFVEIIGLYWSQLFLDLGSSVPYLMLAYLNFLICKMGPAPGWCCGILCSLVARAPYPAMWGVRRPRQPWPYMGWLSPGERLQCQQGT
jgi:hypothetical protein